MAVLLCIETSTKSCSVALGIDGRVSSSAEIITGQYEHAEKLHPFILEVIQKNGNVAGDIEGVAISRGPGSFTGLRIGVAAAKGLCFALDTPLIAIDTLTLMYNQVKSQSPEKAVYIPMIDARRMEAYLSIFDEFDGTVSPIAAEVIDHIFFHRFENKKVVIFGDGATKFQHLLKENQTIVEGVYPSASQMIGMAEEKYSESNFEDLQSFEPYYLKDFIPGIAGTKSGVGNESRK